LSSGNPQNQSEASQPKKSQSGQLIPAVLRPGNYMLVRTQEALNKIFGPSMNPLYYLGAITFLLLWILIATGTYLYLFYDMTPSGAYKSVQYLTEDQKWYGGIIRSMHRYAADGMMIVIAIHIVQVLFSDRFRKYRWVAWISGVAILPVIWLEGLTGYFLVWDEVAQMIAVTSAHIFDALPIFSEPMPRNFLKNDSVNALLFFIFNYLHLAIPCLLLILAWIHCMRISMPVINPPRAVTITILSTLVVLSIIKPAVSADPADLSRLVGVMAIDWFYLFPFPLIDWLELQPAMVWLGGGLLYAIVFAMPWIISDPVKSKYINPTVGQGTVTITQSDCTGCLLCQKACPFEAIELNPRLEGAPNEVEAYVVDDLCSECGFCVNTCEVGAISMGGWSVTEFQNYIEFLFKNYNKMLVEPVVMAFVCERSFDQKAFFTHENTRMKCCEEVAVMTTPCIGVISPAIVDYSFKMGAEGILVIGCRGLDCHYREERRRLKFRDNLKRDRFMVEKMDDPNIEIMLISPFEKEALKKEIEDFKNAVKVDKSGGRILNG